MRVEVLVHANAHDDVEAAVERCLAYCRRQGWRPPRPMVSRPDDPLSPDLGSLLMSEALGALVVPHVGDLLYAGVDLARLKAGRRLTIAEEKVAAVREMGDATRRLVEHGAVLCVADAELRLEGDDAARLADMLESFAGTLTEWNDEERETRSARSKESIEKARAKGVRIGRPPKRPRAVESD